MDIKINLLKRAKVLYNTLGGYMKKGFTLIELMFVIVIIGVVSAAAIISFSNIDNDTSKTELQNKYKDIQRSASIYLDLNTSWLDQFADRGQMFIKLNELKNSNYINQNLDNPLTGEEINPDYYVKIFIKEETDSVTLEEHSYVDTCIVDIKNEGESESINCIANSAGISPCNYNSDCN